MPCATRALRRLCNYTRKLRALRRLCNYTRALDTHSLGSTVPHFAKGHILGSTEPHFAALPIRKSTGQEAALARLAARERRLWRVFGSCKNHIGHGILGLLGGARIGICPV